MLPKHINHTEASLKKLLSQVAILKHALVIVDQPNNIDRLTVLLTTATGTDVKYLFRTVHAPTVPHIRRQTEN